MIDTRTQSFLLSREQLDMLLLESVASTVYGDDDIGQQSSHRHAKQQKTTIDYMQKGRNTFTFLHGVSKHRMYAIKKHFLDNEISSP